jgi:hypothetical protein
MVDEYTMLDQVEITLKGADNSTCTVWIDVADNSLSRKWLTALNELLRNNYHLEKNYCFFGFVQSQRNAEYLTDQMNTSIAAINAAGIGYHIDDHFSIANTIAPGIELIHDKLNYLHRYFEDLQGVVRSNEPVTIPEQILPHAGTLDS